MDPDPSLEPSELDRMVRAVAPGWSIQAASAVDRGHSAVYALELETPGGPRRAVLKASPDTEAHGIATEARLLQLLAGTDSIPVPTLLGAVDEPDDLPAPFFLMAAMPGAAMAHDEIPALEDAVLRRLARVSGRHLAELHGLLSLEGDGAVRSNAAEPATGDPPPADPKRFGVARPDACWTTFLRDTARRDLQALESTRFADLVPAVRETERDLIDALNAPVEPVLGRIDHGVHNLLFDRETGDISAFIDWGFTLAVSRGYDLAVVAYVLSGAVQAPRPGVDDRLELVRDALETGYRAVGQYPSAELSAARRLYELLATVRSMHHLADGVAAVPEPAEGAVAAGLRGDVERLLAEEAGPPSDGPAAPPAGPRA